MKAIKKIFNAIHIFMVYLGIAQLLTMILIVSMQVFSRELFNYSFKWVDEVALILVVWFSFIGMAVGVKHGIHIAIELFTMKLSENIQKNVIAKLAHACTAIIGFVLIYYGIKLAENGLMSTLPATGLRTSVEYLFVPVAGVLIIYESIMDLFGIDKEDSKLEEMFTGGGNEHA
jgi:TRAP-type transport system small permease protein